MTINILANFNNYFNRQVKVFQDIVDYSDYIFYTQTGVNFVPNNGINTSHVVGTNVQMFDGKGDYLIVTDGSGSIVSRWFILDSTRDRAGQYTLTLQRDVIADFYEQVINSPVFIEKATLGDSNDLIFNAENVSVNQILKSHTLLKDQSNCGWFVGYYTKNAPTLEGTVQTNTLEAGTYEVLDTPLVNWSNYKYMVDPFISVLSQAEFSCKYYTSIPLPTGASKKEYRKYTFDTVAQSGTDVSTSATIGGLAAGTSNYSQWTAQFRTVGYQTLNNILKEGGYFDWHTESETNALLQYDGKLIKDSVGRYYNMRVVPAGVVTKEVYTVDGNLFIKLSDIALSAGMTGTPQNDTFGYSVAGTSYKLIATQVEDKEVHYTIPSSGKLVTEDEPYNIFAIPYGTVIVNIQNQDTVITNSEMGKQTISSILGSHGGDGGEGTYVYDAQLIGYCPVQSLITGKGMLTVTDPQQCSFITKGTGENAEKIGVIFHVPSSEFTINIAHQITYDNLKVSNICDMYRLVSPDQGSYFEFSAAKNRGVNRFNIDVTLKPYNPYFHANPDFKELYGADYNTSRGLVYGSNCSLSRALNSFTEYQIQNSQFQNIFSRQMEHLGIQQKYQRVNDIVGGLVGVGTGIGAGALTGSYFMPGIGTGIGAGIGAGASLAGGITDFVINEKLRTEERRYAKDMFDLNLANIQAQPNTLSKVTALTQNNTIFIALEYYTCTEEERLAVANKIAWEGMTVGVFGTLKDYISNYWSMMSGSIIRVASKGFIKARLVRLNMEDFYSDLDWHMVQAISDELEKGVYIQKWA